MAGTREGGRLTGQTNKSKYGDDFYRKIGAKGGRAKVSKGFGVNKELARKAGKKGGELSRRGTSKGV